MIFSGVSDSLSNRFRTASRKTLPVLIGCFAASAFFVSTALGASSNWIPLGSVGNWTTPGNWDNGVPGANPGSSSTDIATFDGTATIANDQVINVDTGRNIGGITFSNTTNFGYLLRTLNDTMNLSSGGVIQTANATGSHTDQIATALVIQGVGSTASFTAGAGSSTSILSFGAVTGASTASNTTTLTIDGSNTGANIITGVIANGGSGGNMAVVKSGTGNWILSNANTFTGGLTIQSGTLTVAASASALGGSGTGAVTLGDGASSASLIIGADSLGTIANPITLATYATGGTLTIGTGGTPPVSITFSGGVTGTNNFTINENGGTGTITFSGGSINNAGTVTNSGAGTGTTLISSVIGTNVTGVTQNSATAALNLTANNTYSGSTTVTSGTLFVNNSSGSGTGTGSLSVASAGILSGTGTIGSSSSSISGALNPGNNGIGILTFSNGVTLNSGSATTIEISGATTRGTDFDGVNFNGSLTVNGGDLTLSFGSTSIADGTTLDIFSGAALTASFTNVIASGTNYNGTLTLNGGNTAYEGYFGSQLVSLSLATGDLTFTAIPEPSTFAAIIGITVLGFGLWRRGSIRK